MLVQFTVKNYKVFKDEAKISFVASHYTEKENDSIVQFPQFNLRLLKSAVIYGANASGKSKLFEAMAFMRDFIISSSKDKQINEPIATEQFRLSTETENEPSFFELIFIYKKVMYRYGFEATKERIVTEWLYQRPKTKEVELFYREGQDFGKVHSKFPVQDLVDKKRIRINALLLSVAATWNDSLAEIILDWVDNSFNVISGLDENTYMAYSISQLKDVKAKKGVLKLIKSADLGIEDMNPQLLKLEDLPNHLPSELKETITKQLKEGDREIYSDVFTTHKKYDDSLSVSEGVKFTIDDEESSGTRKYFALTGPILNTLKKGEVLVIDELDAKLHPMLTRKIIELFNCKENNPNNAQLVFNTHDTNLLDTELFRRDQIWFTEKDRYGAASLYALSDLKGVRKDDPFEKNYIAGKYGAIPFLGDFDNLFND